MTGKTRKPRPASLVEAARRLAGDAAEDETPLTDDERAIIAEVRRELPRPSKKDIREEAKRLLK